MDELFSEKSFTQLQMLHFIASGPNKMRKTKEVVDSVPISQQTVRIYLNDLMDDILQVMPKDASCRLKKIPHGYQIIGAEQDVLARLVLKYGKQSPIFMLLHMVVTSKRFSINNYCEKAYVSSGNFYKKSDKLKVFLANYGLSMNSRFQIIGEEYDIRQLLFSVYFTLFKDIDNPFASFVVAEAQQVLDQFLNEELKTVTFGKSDRNRFLMYLMISVLRINGGHFLHEKNPYFPSERHSSPTIDFLKRRFGFSDRRANLEYQLLKSFLELEKIVPYSTMHYTHDITESFIMIAGDFVKLLKQHSISEADEQSLEAINFGLRNMFKNILLSESKRVDSLFFLREADVSEEFPVQFKICLEFLNTYFQKEPMLNPSLLRNRSLMLHLFISLEEVFELGHLRYDVALRVDCSYGVFGREYIKRKIRQQLALPITIVDSDEQKADILITDRSTSPDTNERILVWNYPPTSSNWETLIASIKEKLRV